MVGNIIGQIDKIARGVIETTPIAGMGTGDAVEIGESHIPGEILQNNQYQAIIFPFGEIEGLRPGANIFKSSGGISHYIKLGPGFIGTSHKDNYPDIDKSAKWHFKPVVYLDSKVSEGSIWGIVFEKNHFEHRLNVPSGIGGKIRAIAKEGEYHFEDCLATIETTSCDIPLYMSHVWSINEIRPFKSHSANQKIFVTGNPYIDIFFPIKRGGVGIITGNAESGKTTLGFNIAKSAKTDIIVYLASFNRDNEIAYIKEQILNCFTTPTIFLCNENNGFMGYKNKSISYGITICEYFRNMGYNVLFLIDSIDHFSKEIDMINHYKTLSVGEDALPMVINNPLNDIIYRSGMVNIINGSCGSLTTIVCGSSDNNDFNSSCRWHLVEKQTPYAPHSRISINESFSDFILPQQCQDFDTLQSINPIKEALKILYETEKIFKVSNKKNLSKIQQYRVEIAQILKETLDDLKGSSLKKQLLGLKTIIYESN